MPHGVKLLSRVGPVIAVALSIGAGGAVGHADARVAHAATVRVPRCGYLRASIPYSHTGSRYRWGVYSLGATDCRTAQTVLGAVMHLHARAHRGTSDADSYFSYRGWRCDFGQMGTQSCWTPGTRPYRARVLAMNCDDRPDGGCPRRVPRTYLG